MKKLIPVVIVAVAVALFYYRGLWLPNPAGTANYLGYVEGETVMIAAPVAGRIVALPAVKGAGIRKGDLVFSLDTVAAQAEVDRTAAAIVTAKAGAADLLNGKREPELDVIRAQRQEAQAGLDLAKKNLARTADLAGTGITAQMNLDQARQQVAGFEAQIAQFNASEQAAELRGREALIEAANSRVKEAEAAAAAARQKLSDLKPVSPVDATVENIFFKLGEWVAAGQPVVSLQAPDDVTLRFYVPQKSLSLAVPGTAVRFSCDGCGGPREAVITRVEQTPEFTPPVIYSEQARSKLVYLVEARIAEAASVLRPGLPVEVEPLQ